MLAKKLEAAVAGQATGTATYVEDVFSTYLYTGNGATKNIRNGIPLGNGPANGTVLQMSGDTLTDSAPIPNTLTTVGSVSVSTSVKKYGTGSISIPGSNSGYLYFAQNSALTLDGDFTIECWARTSNSGALLRIFGIGDALSTSGIAAIYMRGDGVYAYGSNYQIISSGTTQLQDTWYHVALVRQGSTMTMYRDGVSVGSATYSNDIYGTVYVGANNGGGSIVSEAPGYIDDLRVTNGTALYTSNFTPPTAALDLDTLAEGQGGLAWMKGRVAATDHYLQDTVRGTSSILRTNNANGQVTNSSAITNFNSDGFSLGDNGSVNDNAATYVSWTFRKAPKFFDVVTWTGNGANPRAISHSLGSAPGCIIIKRTNDIDDWYVYHRSLATSYYLKPNTTDAQINNTTGKPWNTTPTDTEFYVGGTYGQNITGETYVAYLFAHDAGGFGDAGDQSVIKCGSYTGTETPQTIDLGWEPQWLLIKTTTRSGPSWYLFDNMRGITTGGDDVGLFPNLSSAESSGAWVDLTATGFTLTTGINAINNGGDGYIYIAIRRGPMKTPTDATTVFTPIAGSSGAPTFKPGHVTDTVMALYRPGDVVYPQMWDRLRGAPYLQTSSSNAEVNDGRTWDYMNGAGNFSGDSNYHGECFRRAPGFFDVVAYTGNAIAGTLTYHNLGVAPELIITRVRNVTGEDWVVHYNDGTSIIGAYLNKTDAFTAAGTAPSTDLTNFTSTTYTRNTANQRVNAAKNYVAYLFASCPGVSKVGSFTGNGSSLTVDCGFTNGARFVLIKRTDSTSGWYVWDTARGIVAGDDARLRLESTGAEALWDDIDPDPSGFVAVAAGNINVSGGTYIFLAIA